MLQFLVNRTRSFRARLALTSVLLFMGLVAARIHGSSIACAVRTWAPAEMMDGFLANPLLARMGSRADAWRPWLRAKPAWVREDEWGHSTPAALAQFAHQPRFPVVNALMGNGANMLLLPWAPVVHVSTIARPVTWGYLLFGQQAGLAWAWWWPSFSCFLALYLLFEILLPRRRLLAVVGAGWYAGSAYIGSWSGWPAYVASFAVMTVVCAYHWTKSSSRRGLWGWGAGLGWALSGFSMQLYPPWQIPLAYAGLFIFGGLWWRDRLWRSAMQNRAWRVESAGVVIAMAGVVLGGYAYSSIDALQALGRSVYPGQRRLLGGDFPDWKLFGGLYNYFTHDRSPAGTNESEASSFFMFFPAVAIAAVASRHIRSRLDPVAWMLLGLALFLVFFSVFKVPGWFAAVSLFSRCQGYRAQIALGLISIVLSMQLVAAARSGVRPDPGANSTALAVLGGCAGLYLFEGARFQSQYKYFSGADSVPSEVLWVSLGAAGLCTLMALGSQRLFAVLLGAALFVTSWTFNPLSVGFPEPRNGEMGRAIADVLQHDPWPNGRQSLWLTLGDNHYVLAPIVQTMGVRTVGGYYQYPQLDLWRALDPEHQEESKYNRFASVTLERLPDGTAIQFVQPSQTTMVLQLSPLDPLLWNLGVRYVLTYRSSAGISATRFNLLHESTDPPYSIWEIPPPW